MKREDVLKLAEHFSAAYSAVHAFRTEREMAAKIRDALAEYMTVLRREYPEK